MRFAFLTLASCLFSVGCAESVDSTYAENDDTGASSEAATDAAKSDTGAATTPDTGTIEDSTLVEDTTSPADTGSAATDSEFPDFGGGGLDSGFPSFDGGFATTCTMDGECMSPFNCCDTTKSKCGFKLGTMCSSF